MPPSELCRLASGDPTCGDGRHRGGTAAQRRFATAADADVLAKLSPAQNDIIRLTDAERALFVEAVTPLVAEQRHAFGAQLCGYLE